MAKKTGLGRGLDALFSDTIKEPEIEEVTGEIVQNIKITKIIMYFIYIGVHVIYSLIRTFP